MTSKGRRSSLEDLVFHRYDAAGARDRRDQIEEIFRGAYVDRINFGGEFESPEAFMQRFEAYTRPDRKSGFELVIAESAGLACGQAWGWPLCRDSAWWEGVRLDEAEVGFTTENGARTFALSEIMVRSEFMGQGIARALHDELLGRRSEQRATLLVEPGNRRAYAAYQKWGWYRVGSLRPRWPDAPTFDVLMRDLVAGL